MFKQAVIYRTSELKSEHFNDEMSLNVLLNEHRYTPCSHGSMLSSGWHPINDAVLPEESLVRKAGTSFFICLRKEEKKIPPSTIKQELQKRIKHISENENRKVYSKEKASIKDDIIATLAPRAFSVFKDIHAFISPRENLIVVESSFNGGEEVLNLLRESLGSLKVKPLMTQSAPATIMTSWLSNDKSKGDWELGAKLELENPIAPDGKGVISIRNDECSSDEVLGYIDRGYFVKKLHVLTDAIEFQIKSDLMFSGIKATDALKDEILNQSSNLDDENDAVLAAMDAQLIIGSEAILAKINEAIRLFDGEAV